MYIVLINSKLIGVFTSHTDAAETAKKHPHKKVYYCLPNSTDVTIWDNGDKSTHGEHSICRSPSQFELIDQ